METPREAIDRIVRAQIEAERLKAFYFGVHVPETYSPFKAPAMPSGKVNIDLDRSEWHECSGSTGGLIR